MNREQAHRVRFGRGIIASLEWARPLEQRIISSRAFAADRLVAAVLPEVSMPEQLDGCGVAEFLWQRKRITPLVAIDSVDDADLQAVSDHGAMGVVLRSEISMGDEDVVASVVGRQMQSAQLVLRAGLVPVLEPDVVAVGEEKRLAERVLRRILLAALDDLGDGEVVLGLALPEIDGFYGPLLEHPRVLRVAALSGARPRSEELRKLAHNPDMISGFGPSLFEGLSASQDDHEFTRTLNASVRAAYLASVV